MLRWAAKIITSKSSSCYHIDTKCHFPNPLHIHPLHYPIDCFCFHLPHLCPQRYSKDLELLLDHGPHQGMSHTTEVDFITDYQVKQRHVFQDTGAKSMACIWACPVIQAPICMAASTGNLSDPKNDDRNVVTQTLPLKGFHLKKGTW